MSSKEQIIEEINGLGEAELDQIAQYVAFIKYRSLVMDVSEVRAAELAALYAEFPEEDKELAEEGMSGYADALANEDVQ